MTYVVTEDMFFAGVALFLGIPVVAAVVSVVWAEIAFRLESRQERFEQSGTNTLRGTHDNYQ